MGEDIRLLTLVGCIHGIVLEFDEQVRYVNVWADDPALLAMPREQALGRTINDVLGPQIGARFTTLVEQVFATGETRNVEYPLVIRGQLRWFFADIKRVTVGDRTTVVLFGRDISERKQAEERLRESEERYRLVAQATNDVLYDWNIENSVVTWGPNATTVFAGEIASVSEAWRTRLHPEDDERVRSSLDKALTNGDPSWQIGYRFRRGDGSYCDVHDRGFIVRDDQGKPLRMVGSMTDVTHLNRLQAQVVQQDRLAAMGLLAAGVGHEINNPLCYVLGNLEHALDDGTSNEDAREALRDAQDGARRIMEIVKSLKLFSREDVATEATDVQVEDVVEQALKMAESDIRHRARLVRNYGKTPPAHVNESRLGQVCLNLIINAAQAIAPGNSESNEIAVTTGRDASGRIFLSVSDTGMGIPPDQIDRVFDPFFTTKPVGVGTGIGLSVCLGIVKSMGGELTVTSKRNERTTFVVSLPAPTIAKSRVLVVDDEPAVGRYIARVLKDECEVTVVQSARDALARLEANTDFDVILCDVMMPEMNGIELYGIFRQRFASIVPRVQFMTGGAFTTESARFLDALPRRPLDKPMTKDVLKAVIAAQAA